MFAGISRFRRVDLDPTCNTKVQSLVWRKLFASSSNNPEQDVAVIGGGPGGYVAAIKAAQLGLKVEEYTKLYSP